MTNDLKRIAVYTRVDITDDDATTFLELLKDYYRNFVNAHPGWELVDIYWDEGINSVQGRQRLMDD